MANYDYEDGQNIIDYGELFMLLVSKWFLIIACTMVFAILGFIGSKLFIKPLFQSTSVMLVNSGDRGSDYVTGEQISSSTTLVNVYSIIIKSDAVMAEVLNNLKEDNITYDDIEDIRITPVDNTPVMEISVICSEPEKAYKICNEITKISPDVIVDSVGGGTVKMLSSTTIDYDPISPNLKKNTLLSAFVGMLLCCGLILLFELLDNKVKKESDISALGLIVIGSIPTYDKMKNRFN